MEMFDQNHNKHKTIQYYHCGTNPNYPVNIRSQQKLELNIPLSVLQFEIEYFHLNIHVLAVKINNYNNNKYAIVKRILLPPENIERKINPYLNLPSSTVNDCLLTKCLKCSRDCGNLRRGSAMLVFGISQMALANTSTH